MPPKETQARAAPKATRESIVSLLSTPQFYWFGGHFLVLVSFTLYTIKSFFSRSLFWYKTALIGVLFTYTIALQQGHLRSISALKSPNLIQRLIRDENFHYFTLALILYLSSGYIGAVTGGLYSFAIFSLFHFLAYFQNHILPITQLSIAQQQQISTKIANLTSKFNEPALMIAASSEVLLLTGFVLSIPLTIIRIFKAPMYSLVNVSVFIYVVAFLKLRYTNNKYTQYVINMYDTRISQFLLSPQGQIVPPQIKQSYFNFRTGLINTLAPIGFSKIGSKTQ